MAFDIDEQYDKIYRFCYLRVKHRETAEDITQETFLRYLERPQYITQTKPFSCFILLRATSVQIISGRKPCARYLRIHPPMKI